MRFLILLCLLLQAAIAAGPEGRTVYVIPMAGGLDQYLANQLSAKHALAVTADPKAADLVFTDRLGEALSEQLDLWQAPPPEAEEKADEKAEKKDEAKGDALTTFPKAAKARPVFSSFGGGKGTLFLVDAKTRQVVWSTFERPKDNEPQHLDRTAERIVSRLKKDLQPSAAPPRGNSPPDAR